MTDLLASIDDLLAGSPPSATLVLDPESASLARQSLLAALYGGRWPEGGRAVLLRIVDALRPSEGQS